MIDGTRPSSDANVLRRPFWRVLAFCATLMGLITIGVFWSLLPQSRPLELPGGELVEGDPAVVEAIRKADSLVRQTPASASAWGNLGKVLHVHSFADSATLCYGKAQELDGQNPEWPYLRAIILIGGSTPSDALSELQRAASLDGLGIMPRLRLGEFLLDQGRLDEAQEQFTKVSAADATSQRAHFRLAQTAAERKNWTECLAHLDAVGETRFARKQTYLLRRLCFQRLGNEEKASKERLISEKLPDDPPWPDPVLEKMDSLVVGFKGRLLAAKRSRDEGDIHGCLEILTSTVRDYPNSDVCWMALGRTQGILGNLPAAEDALRKSLAIAPDVADVWMSLAHVRALRGNSPGAIECLNNVIRLKPMDADAHFRLGKCLSVNGDRDGAIEAYRQALRYKPNFEDARAQLNHLSNGQ